MVVTEQLISERYLHVYDRDNTINLKAHEKTDICRLSEITEYYLMSPLKENTTSEVEKEMQNNLVEKDYPRKLLQQWSL